MGYKLYTSVTHTGLPDLSWAGWILSSAQELVYHRACTVITASADRVKVQSGSYLHPSISTSTVLQKLLMAVNSAGTLPIKWKHRAADSCDGGLSLRKIGDTDFTL